MVESGSTSAPALGDCEITVSAGYWSVDLDLVVASSPRSARVCLASARVMPLSSGTSTPSGAGCRLRLGLGVFRGNLGRRWGGVGLGVGGGGVGNASGGNQEDDADSGGDQDAATALGLRLGRGGAGSPLADRVMPGCWCAPGADWWGHRPRRGWIVEGGVGDVDMGSAPLPDVPASRAGASTRPRAAPGHPPSHRVGWRPGGHRSSASAGLPQDHVGLGVQSPSLAGMSERVATRAPSSACDGGPAHSAAGQDRVAGGTSAHPGMRVAPGGD